MPTLVGCGELAAYNSPAVSLETHIDQLCVVLESGDRAPVTLVAHSYGTVVVTGVLDRVPDLVDGLVYVDGYVPVHGGCAADLAPGRREALVERAIDGWLVPPGPPSAFGVMDDRDADWLAARLTPQSLATFLEPIVLEDETRLLHRRKTHVQCTARERRVPRPEGKGWRLRQIDTGHDCMITAPQELSDIIHEHVAG